MILVLFPCRVQPLVLGEVVAVGVHRRFDNRIVGLLSLPDDAIKIYSLVWRSCVLIPELLVNYLLKVFLGVSSILELSVIGE